MDDKKGKNFKIIKRMFGTLFSLIGIMLIMVTGREFKVGSPLVTFLWAICFLILGPASFIYGNWLWLNSLSWFIELKNAPARKG